MCSVLFSLNHVFQVNLSVMHLTIVLNAINTLEPLQNTVLYQKVLYQFLVWPIDQNEFIWKKFDISAQYGYGPLNTYYLNDLNSQYFGNWTDANPIKIFSRAATASKL